MKIALRSLAKSPGFSLIAVLTLALGIGLSASSFSMANAFLLRNVPYPDAERLVRIFGTSRQSPRGNHAPANIIELREAVKSFSGFTIYSGDGFPLGEPGQPAERVNCLSATANFFDVLGVHPTLGRGFTSDEDQLGKPRVAILTQRAWSRYYGSDPAVIGRTVRLAMEPCTIVGVLPPEFDAPLVWGSIDFIIPQTLFPSFRESRDNAWMAAFARLKPGVSLAQAQSELDTLAARFAANFPKENTGRGLSVANLSTANMDSVSRSLLWLMTGLSLAMLLIACANLASLQVARAFARSREFAVRAALGGSRSQLMLPLLSESLVLATVGGLLGLLVAHWSNRIIGSLLLINGDFGYNIPIDGRVFGFAAFATLLSGVAFGLAPAWLASRSPAAEALKEGSRSSTGSRSHQRLKRTLIVGELAIALTVVAVAAAFGVGARSFMKRSVGWDMDGLFSGYLALPYSRYSDDAVNRQFQRTLLDRLATIPGVEQAFLCGGNVPVFAIGGTDALVIEGRPLEERGREPLTQVGAVSAAYFSALKIPLKTGALFSANLTEKDPLVCVVNETFAQRFWPNENAIGRRVRLGDSQQWIEIIGIVADIQHPARLTPPDSRLQLYRPLVQAPTRYMSVVLRSSLAPEALTKSVRDAVAAIDPDQPVASPGSVRAAFDRNLSNLNLVIVNLGISAGMGLLIAGVGLFGVISQLTLQRTRDIGVRMALGAGSPDIMRMILGEGVWLLAIALVIGIPSYFGMSIVLRRAMPEMQLPGVWLLALNVTVLGAIALLACWLPARRATRINPVEALRSE